MVGKRSANIIEAKVACCVSLALSLKPPDHAARLAVSSSSFVTGRWRYSKLSFSKAPELVRDGAHSPHC